MHLTTLRAPSQQLCGIPKLNVIAFMLMMGVFFSVKDTFTCKVWLSICVLAWFRFLKMFNAKLNIWSLKYFQEAGSYCSASKPLNFLGQAQVIAQWTLGYQGRV